MRSALYLGSYAALVLAPLIAAAIADPIAAERPFLREVAAAFGFVAFGLLAIELALVTRVRAVGEAFGSDAVMLFHRHMGLAGLAFLLAHVALLVGLDSWRTLDLVRGGLLERAGLVALLAVTAIVASSVLRRRLRLRYERWLLAHRWLALALVAAMLVHSLAARGYSRSRGVEVVLMATAAVFLASLVWYRTLRPLRELRRPWVVLENRAEGASTHTLALQALGHTGLAFEPGQFVWLTTARTPFATEEHPISIASSPELERGARLELAIKELGDWSRTVVPTLGPGARVWLDGPFGAFSIDRAPAQRFVLVAGGIGITPMRSMLLAMRDRGDRREVVLLYAARNRSRAPFAAELEALRDSLALRLVFVFEERSQDPRDEHGYVTTDVLRRHVQGDLAHTDFFLCGPVPMMEAVEDSLASLGVAPARIHTERFDMV